ncbi:MAG: type VI secretion system lipoprotein TssJ [Nitrococcus mobilis]|nr:type VI secretion system lipoprotein TssJ [Nitrococcus mobilis]
MKLRCFPQALAVIFLVAAMLGCTSQPMNETETEEVDGRIVVGPNLNPNAEGRPSPVFMRIYQLSDETDFVGASFAELADRDQEVLGAALLSRDELELCPVEATERPRSGQASRCQGPETGITLNIRADARYLAVMAEFYNLRDPSGNWRSVAEIPEEGLLGFLGSREFVISLEGSTVSVSFRD